MSHQIASGGPVVFLEGHQAYTWFPIPNVLCLGQQPVTDSAIHVATPLTISVKQAGKNYNVNTVNHCIFCLRKTESNPETITLANISNYSASAEQSKKVPCAPPGYTTSAAAPLLLALNKTWSHLQKGGSWDWDDDQGNLEQPSTKFTSVPKICLYCAAEFSSISDLMSQLKAQINKLGVIVRESKKGGAYSWRSGSFERKLKGSAVDRQCISDTLEFLGIPQESQSTAPEPTSLVTRTFGNTMDTKLPSVNIKETLLSEQPKEEETSQGHLDFHDEGSEDDGSIEYHDDDVNDDPNYVKEEDDASSDSEDSQSPTDDFDEDPLNDSKSELDHSLTSCPNVVEMSCTDSIMLPSSRSTSKASTQSVVATTRDPRTRRKKFTCTINGCGTTSNWLKRIRIHQEKVHNYITEPETPSSQQQNPNNECSICRKTFRIPRDLRRHNRLVHDNTTDNNVCSICGKTFKHKYSLRGHIKQQHTNGKCKVATFRCDLCNIHVPKKNNYEHVRAHVGEEYLIRCPNPNSGQCSFVCCTSRGLQAHLRQRITCRTATPDVNEKYLKPRDAFTCQVCGEDLGNLLSLRVHLNDWHEKEGTKEFPCPIQGCPQRFSWRQSVVLHITSHINKVKSWKIQPCDVCKEQVKCEEMGKHLKETHNLAQELIIKCFQCPFLFSERNNLVDHLYEHRHIALFCDICGNPDTTFYRHNDLRRHYFEVHQIGSKFLCEHCQSEYFSASGLERHLAERHPAAAKHKKQKRNLRKRSGCSDTISEKNFKCDECDAVYKTKKMLASHKITIHKGKLFQCKFCDQTFSSCATKYSHEKKHRRGPGDYKKVFPCQVPGCGKELPSNYALQKHVSWVHEGEKSNVCDQCGKAYPSSTGLRFHVQSVHMGIRNHVCDICGESFTNVTVLKRHKLIHTGDRPYACELCGQKFRHKEVLKRHVEGHERKGAEFKPNGPMKQLRKRVDLKSKTNKS